MFRRLTNAVRGLAWLVRGNGLQAEVTRLREVPPPEPFPTAILCERLDRLELALRVLTDRPSPEPFPLGLICERLDRLELSLRVLTDRPPPEPFPLGLICERLDRLEYAAIHMRQWADGTDTAALRAEWERAGDLRAFERKVFSQQGEDGILEEIFRRVGTTNRYFVEFGVETGVQCNAAHLARNHGWSGLFMEASPTDFAALEKNFADLPGVTCRQAIVTSANVEEHFTAAGVPAEPDLLSIDIDGNDYWVWKAITAYRPRVLVMEYNPFHPPPERWVMAEDPTFRWGGTTYFGASLTSLTLLSREKGYELVGTDSRGVNAFFVRTDCLGGKFLDPVLHYHFTRFGYPSPPVASGPFVEV